MLARWSIIEVMRLYRGSCGGGGGGGTGTPPNIPHTPSTPRNFHNFKTSVNVNIASLSINIVLLLHKEISMSNNLVYYYSALYKIADIFLPIKLTAHCKFM